jgi:hypothetical protein
MALKPKRKYNEIFKLKEMLEKEGIPFDFFDRSPDDEEILKMCPDLCEWWQIIYPAGADDEHRYISVIESFGSYGRKKDLLEIMGGLTPEEQQENVVKGWLTAEDVFTRIKNHYDNNK